MRPELISLYLALLLPLFLTYLLIALRTVEKRRLPDAVRSTDRSILSVRDAALTTIALDVSALVGNFNPYTLPYSLELLALPLALFFAHMMAFLYVMRVRSDRYRDERTPSTSRVMEAYLSLMLLMTNAVTLLDIMHVLRRGL